MPPDFLPATIQFFNASKRAWDYEIFGALIEKDPIERAVGVVRTIVSLSKEDRESAIAYVDACRAELTLDSAARERALEALQVELGNQPEVAAILDQLIPLGDETIDVERQRSERYHGVVFTETQPIFSKRVSDLLARLVKAQGIPEQAQEGVRGEITQILVRAKAEVAGKPKWRNRLDHPDLAGLTAPKFLRQAHPDLIVDNTVQKVAIRRVDPELMDAIEQYISQRKRRGVDLGDASGLLFISKHPARNRISRTESLKKRYGKRTKDVVEGMREVGRAQARSRRSRRRREEEPS